jgi:uncharacterized GH25 family protein
MARSFLNLLMEAHPRAQLYTQAAKYNSFGCVVKLFRRRVAPLFGEVIRKPVRPSRGPIMTIVALTVLLLFGATAWKVAAGSATAQSTAAETKEKKKLQFELHVVGPDGKPVPRAQIDIRSNPAPTREQIKSGEFVRRSSYGTIARADANGQLLLEFAKLPKNFSLGIEAPNFGPYWAAWNSTHHPEKIPSKFVAELEAGWSVGGIVVDSEGKPVVNAAIHPSIKFKKRPGDAEELYVGTDLKTDKSGRWSYLSVPASAPEFSVEIHHVDYMIDLRSLTRAEFGIANGKEPTGKIVLSRGLTVAGKVLDDAGKPIAGALVRSKFMNDIRETKSGADGSYRLSGCQPVMARVVVSAKGRAMELKEVRVEPVMQPVDFMLKSGGKIHIRVVDKQGNPIPKTRIFFQRWRGPIRYFEFDHVNGYANDKGVWEWNEAPLDAIQADICPPNGMQLTYQSLIARDEEYVFRPPAALVITGTVVDAETKQPIKSFRVVPGIRSRDSHIDWVRQESYAAKDGKFRIRQDRGYPGHLVRIEADGYQAAVSEDIKSDEENVTVDFELKKGVNIAATILTPAGAPAAGAKIVLGVAKSQISIQNGSIDDGSTYAARVDAGSDGKFHLPPQDTAFQLIITHPSGYASIQSGPDWTSSTIKLHLWTRVEGTFRAGEKIVANVPLTIQQGALDSWGDDVPHVSVTHYTTTGPDGRFVFERVLPGEGRIGRRIMLMVTDGATEVTSSKMMPLQCVGGETAKIDLGNDGRPIVGQLAPPKDFKEKVLWNFALISLEAEQAPLDAPPAPAAIQNDPEKYQAWWNEWQLTKEGQAWRAINDTNERIRKTSPYITASVDRDGSFRIDDVPPGTYRLSVRFDQHAAGRLRNHRLSVPAIEAEQADEPLDLGVLTLERN